jgi:hypothetical protein
MVLAQNSSIVTVNDSQFCEILGQPLVQSVDLRKNQVDRQYDGPPIIQFLVGTRRQTCKAKAHWSKVLVLV